MALIQFTKNHSDHSTDKGYQFEFFCDRCGNGFMSEFKASVTGYAASAVRTAGDLWKAYSFSKTGFCPDQDWGFAWGEPRPPAKPSV